MTQKANKRLMTATHKSQDISKMCQSILQNRVSPGEIEISVNLIIDLTISIIEITGACITWMCKLKQITNAAEIEWSIASIICYVKFALNAPLWIY